MKRLTLILGLLLWALPAFAADYDLSWRDVWTGESSITIQRRTMPAGAYATIYTAAANATTYRDSGCPGTCRYRVTATIGGVVQPYSGEACVPTACSPAAPTNVHVSGQTAPTPINLSATLYTPGGSTYWTGILAPARATDWTTAGVVGGVPSAAWTQCGSTIAGGTSGSPTSRTTVNNALAACGTNQYVKLAAGYFQGGISWTKSNVALRGSGADQTFITAASTTMQWYPANVSMYSSSIQVSDFGQWNGTPKTWIGTAGQSGVYTKGATGLDLNNTTGITANSTLVLLDQRDDTSDTGNYFVSGKYPYVNDGTTCNYRNNGSSCGLPRPQIHLLVPTGVTSSTITIPSPGVIQPQWATGKTPQAYIVATAAAQFLGLEDLSIDTISGGGNDVNGAVNMVACYNCWVSGVRFDLTGAKAAFVVTLSSHVTFRNNYIYNDPAGIGEANGGDSYGIFPVLTSHMLLLNNIIQRDRSPIVYNGPATGDVIAYNFAIANAPTAGGHWSFWQHNGAADYMLYEGNIASGFANDDMHGTANMVTTFRNRYHGVNEAVPTVIGSQFSQPYVDGAYHRFSNLVGNVLGTATVQSIYEYNNDNLNDGCDNSCKAIYMFGAYNVVSAPPNADPVSTTTAMRWGNWDSATNTIRWQASEKASGATTYPGIASPTQTLPPSFFLSSKPAWWDKAGLTVIPWPPTGPDVTGGTLPRSDGSVTWAAQNSAGHANMNPAMRCYKEVMNGPANGSGAMLTFNAASCYP